MPSTQHRAIVCQNVAVSSAREIISRYFNTHLRVSVKIGAVIMKMISRNQKWDGAVQ